MSTIGYSMFCILAGSWKCDNEGRGRHFFPRPRGSFLPSRAISTITYLPVQECPFLVVGNGHVERQRLRMKRRGGCEEVKKNWEGEGKRERDTHTHIQRRKVWRWLSDVESCARQGNPLDHSLGTLRNPGSPHTHTHVREWRVICPRTANPKE